MKEKLAILGGKPIRHDKIFYGKQYIDEDDIKAVENVLRSPLITCGPKVQEMEDKICQMTGAKYALLVSNGTAALHLACMAEQLHKGDEVITTPITFAASSNCILYCNATPVFADVDKNTYNISPIEIEKKITKNTKGIIAVDYTGQAAQLNEIRSICEQHHLFLIEDAAHALGTSYCGKMVGSIADITTFSFHPVKTITGGEGGAITTNDFKLYKRMKLLRTHGITRNYDEMCCKSNEPWYNEQVELGFNYRITDFQAALLISQLNKLNQFIHRRKEIVGRYNAAFTDMKEIIIQENINESDTAPHLYVLQLNIEELTVNREQIFKALAAENIIPNVHYMPVYYHGYYQKLGYQKGICPEAEKLYDAILTLPLYYSMTDSDVEDVIAAVKKVISFYSKDRV